MVKAPLTQPKTATGKKPTEKKILSVRGHDIKIPKKFKASSRTFQVKYDPKIITAFNTQSYTDFHAGRIILAPATNSYDRSIVDIQSNFFKEVVTIFFSLAQDEEGKEDIKFITLFANCLQQALATATYEKSSKDDFKFTKIPTTFQIFGKTFAVDEDCRILYNNQAVGMAEYHKEQISLHMSDESLEHAPDDEYHTFMHELVHIIFSSIGEYEKNENETFVNLLAGHFAQVFASSEY